MAFLTAIFLMCVIGIIGLILTFEVDLAIQLSFLYFGLCAHIVMYTIAQVKIWSSVNFYLFFIVIQYIALMFSLAFDIPFKLILLKQDDFIFYMNYWNAINVLGFTFFIMGYLTIKTKLDKDKFVKILNFNTISLSNYLVYLPIFASFAMFIYIAYLKGGVGNMLSAMSNITGYYDDVITIRGSVKIGYVTTIFLILNGQKRRAITSFVLISVLIALLGKRGDILSAGIFPLLLVCYFIYPKLKKTLVITVFAIFSVLYISVNTARYSENDIGVMKSVALSLSKIEHHVNGIETIAYFDQDKLYGEYYSSLLYWPIPRSLWKEKPIVAESGLIGQRLKNTDSISGVGLPPGKGPYAYANFGFVGVAIIYFFSGFLLCLVEAVVARRPTVFILVGYSLCMPFLFYPFSTESQIKIVILVFQLILLYLFSKLTSKGQLL